MKAHDMRVKLRTEAIKFFGENSTWLPKYPERASIYHLLVTWTECLPKTSEVMQRGLGTLKYTTFPSVAGKKALVG
jgi:hypothetical protein